MKLKKTIAIAFALAAVASATLAATWHVATTGDDATGDGSVEKPLATVARAVELSRGAGAGEAKEIILGDGIYRIDTPVDLGERDAGLVIRAAHPGKAVLSGAVPIVKWEQDPVDNRILVADFPFEISPSATYSLVVNGQVAKLALFPAAGQPPLPYFAKESDANHTVFRYDKAKLPAPDVFKDLDLASTRIVIPQEWVKNQLFVATNDWEGGVFYLKSRTSMPLGRFNQGYRISNSRHGLTGPGIWMYEGSTGKMRYWPREGETPETMKASVTHALRIFTVTKAKNVRFSGLVLEGCARLPGSGNNGKVGQAAPIGGTDPVGVRVENCEIRNTSGYGIWFVRPVNCEVRRCRIRETGGHGIGFMAGGEGGGVYGCEISDAGSTGAYLQLPRVTLKDCHIHHVGRSGATLWTSKGLVVSNEFDHTMLSSRDAGAVYGAMNDSLFEGNYCHDCGDWPGLYNDEGGKNTVYRGNRFEGCWWPIHMHDCRQIVVTNNTMACDMPMRFSFQGSADCVFKDNLLRAPKEIDSDPYVDNCAVWENTVETGSFKTGWKDGRTVRLEKEIKPLKAPCAAFPTKGPLFPTGKLDATAFSTPWRQARAIDRDAAGHASPGVPGCFLYFGFDEKNLYVKVNYEYNKFVYYPGSTKADGHEWGVHDGIKLRFETFDVTVFLDGTVESSDETLRFDAANASVAQHGGPGAKGHTTFVAIPLSRFGLAGKDLSSLEGQKILFDAASYNAEYNETRYYEGPSKGEKPAGVVVLGKTAK